MTNITQIWEPLLFALFTYGVLHCTSAILCRLLPLEEKAWTILKTVWDTEVTLTWKDGFMIGFNMFLICSLVQVFCTYALRFFASRFLVESVPIVFGATADFIMLLLGILALLRKKYWYASGILIGFFLVTDVISLCMKFAR